jgi:hypothetical protein
MRRLYQNAARRHSDTVFPDLYDRFFLPKDLPPVIGLIVPLHPEKKT